MAGAGEVGGGGWGEARMDGKREENRVSPLRLKLL